MKFRLIDIDLAFKKLRERIVFTDFTYFHGQMGAGKSTIARLIDFCLGGHLGEAEMTPALQTEFVSANLSLEVEGVPLSLERHAHSTQIRARWASTKTNSNCWSLHEQVMGRFCRELGWRFCRICYFSCWQSTT